MSNERNFEPVPPFKPGQVILPIELLNRNLKLSADYIDNKQLI
jgi:hypothetical protein